MSNIISFVKMHGIGNDYIYVDAVRNPIADPIQTAITWSSHHTGIGADGLVLIVPSQKADFGMRIFNADGSEAAMCGNASRCVGKYVYEHGLTTKKEITLETHSGIKVLKLHITKGIVEQVSVDMGEPSDIKQVHLGESFPYTGITVNMGNPHLVIFVNDITTIELNKIGPLLERHPLFPNKVNVEFAQIIEKDQIRMRVWERGSGITLACGTGACATTVAATFLKRIEAQTQVVMDGGILSIEWDKENTNHVTMKGSATHVFEGKIAIPDTSDN